RLSSFLDERKPLVQHTYIEMQFNQSLDINRKTGQGRKVDTHQVEARDTLKHGTNPHTLIQRTTTTTRNPQMSDFSSNFLVVRQQTINQRHILMPHRH